MFMPNSEKSPTAVEQISSMISRYNELVEDVRYLEDLQKKKDYELLQLKRQMTFELSELRTRVHEIGILVDKAAKYKVNVGREFKQIIKTDNFNKLSKRIDALDFENKMSRDEFFHLLER